MSELKDILKKYNDSKNEPISDTFDVFSLFTTGSHKENFHSEIIANLLNPKGIHKQKNKYLMLFWEYLKSFEKKTFDIDNYQNAKVKTEYSIKDEKKGRIDVCVWDESSKHCIIIENKMNNAGDMPEQIWRYYNYMEKKGYAVDAIVYIPLYEAKGPNKNWSEKARKDIPEINKLLCISPAYIKGEKNLVDDWLNKCIENTSDDDVKKVLEQYANHIKKRAKSELAKSEMDMSIMRNFYEYICNNQDVEQLPKEAKELKESLPQYMVDRLFRVFVLEPLVLDVWKAETKKSKGDWGCHIIVNCKPECRISIFTSGYKYGVHIYNYENDTKSIIADSSFLSKFSELGYKVQDDENEHKKEYSLSDECVMIKELKAIISDLNNATF